MPLQETEKDCLFLHEVHYIAIIKKAIVQPIMNLPTSHFNYYVRSKLKVGIHNNNFIDVRFDLIPDNLTMPLQKTHKDRHLFLHKIKQVYIATADALMQSNLNLVLLESLSPVNYKYSYQTKNLVQVIIGIYPNYVL